ncbi:hypothetical protein PIIN_10919 [Serendipita indica DSM 11827]|uniref:Uncharacterized protein n=1 Tax=Serendipita indica (strain DSM 11827) TaxID=1109443 RepID=G4U043_SERID|nr:hypothetical protein PIIN_10919 [Serendipita indica DSM 11827]
MRINSKDPAGTHASTGNEHLAGVHQSRASIRSPNLEHNLNDSRQERHNGSTHTPRSKPPSSAVIEPRSALPQRRDNDKCNVLKKLMNSFTFFNVLVLLFAWLICFFPAAEKPIEESPWVDFVRAQKQFGLIPRSTSILRQGYSDIRKVGEILDELSGSVLNSTLVFRKPIVSQLQTVLDSATEADYRLLELEEAIRRAFDNVIKASQRNIHELEILLAPRDALTGFIPKSIQAYAVRRKRRRHLVSACDEMLTEVKPFVNGTD